VTAAFVGGGALASASGELVGVQVVENSPPVAGSGTAVAFGASVTRASGLAPAGSLDGLRAAELWLRALPASGGDATLLRVGEAGAPALLVSLTADRAGVVIAAGGASLAVPTPLADGSWHQLAVSAADGRLSALVDGVPAAESDGTVDCAGATEVALGEGFTGELDEVRLWSSPRSAADVLADLRRPVRADAPGLAALWRMDEGGGTVLLDAGPAQADLVLAAAADATPFVPSTAWRDRTVRAGETLSVVDAGYDAAGGAVRELAMPTAVRRLAALLGLGLAAAARAQAPGPMPVQTYAPTPPGDAFFTVPSTRAPGHLAAAAGVALSYAHEPLVLERDGHRVPGGRLVREQTWAFLQASLGVDEFVRVDAALPLVLGQAGDRFYSGVGRVDSTGVGNLRLGGQLSLFEIRGVEVAAGLDLWLPSASRRSYATDGAARAQPRAVAGSGSGRLTYGAQVGMLLARKLDVGYSSTGSGVVWGGGVAWRLGPFRVGPEVWGRLGLGGTESPSEVLLGAHFQPSVPGLELGLAASTAIRRDPGAAPARLVLTAAWTPGAPAQPARE
jgi:hypothetical protein